MESAFCSSDLAKKTALSSVPTPARSMTESSQASPFSAAFARAPTTVREREQLGHMRESGGERNQREHR
ncbi:hypothetical protein TIFTF001_023549 [Ficus carica]|uniref:Uncharacterized protein n=1 Tax=Ficus carica TaxID=3494 RepID=A0AA88ANN2_FICCA|nr:hypothetical protein TIFTF001_023549 [Ficus carica]